MKQETESRIIVGIVVAVGAIALAGSITALGFGAMTLGEAATAGGIGIISAVALITLKG